MGGGPRSVMLVEPLAHDHHHHPLVSDFVKGNSCESGLDGIQMGQWRKRTKSKTGR